MRALKFQENTIKENIEPNRPNDIGMDEDEFLLSISSKAYLSRFLTQLAEHYELVKMLSVWMCVMMCVWMLTRVEEIVTAAHRDL